jgi:hypothetical protein
VRVSVSANAAFFWTVIGLLALIAEGVAIVSHRSGDTLSEEVRWHLRYSPMKWVFVPFMCWIFWHFVIRSWQVDTFSWRDLLAVGIGLAWCIVEGLVGYGPTTR